MTTTIKPLEIATAEIFVQAINSLADDTRTMFANALLEGFRNTVNELHKERSRKSVDVSDDMSRSATLKVLEATTLIDAMKEAGIPFSARHSDGVYMRRDGDQWTISIYQEPCGCEGDCCGHAFESHINLAKVGRTWVAECSTLYNF